MVNIHDDHEATCLCCKHLLADYEPDWSDITPGVGYQCICVEGHWKDDLQPFRWHKMVEFGRECKDFVPRPTDD